MFFLVGFIRRDFGDRARLRLPLLYSQATRGARRGVARRGAPAAASVPCGLGLGRVRLSQKGLFVQGRAPGRAGPGVCLSIIKSGLTEDKPSLICEEVICGRASGWQ